MENKLLVKNILNSRITRDVMKIEAKGDRVISPKSQIQKKEEGGGFWGGVKSVGGFLWNSGKAALGFVGFSFSAIWSGIVGATRALYTFNFNISDEDLDAQVKSGWNTFAGSLGGLAGSSLGYLVCGIVPSATMFMFNEALAAKMLKEVGEEAIEEIASQVQAVTVNLFRQVGRSAFAWGFKGLRGLLKHKNSPLRKLLGDKVVDEWGKRGKGVVSIASKVEQAVESIPNEFLRNFTEEFLEEFGEACIEAGYIIANAADQFFLDKKTQSDNVLGKQQVVEITPNRAIDDEKIILSGKQEILKPAIVQTIANYNLLEDRDVGAIIGSTVSDYLKPKPLDSIRLLVKFSSKRTPPFKGRRTEGIVTATYKIPEVSRAKCDWLTIKNACGGANGYMWGRYRATATLRNGRQMAVYGATSDEARDRLEALAYLSNSDIISLRVSEEEKAGSKLSNSRLFKTPTRIYPIFCTILNPIKMANPDAGIPTLYGAKKDRLYKLALWGDKEPIDFDEKMSDLFRTPGIFPQTIRS